MVRWEWMKLTKLDPGRAEWNEFKYLDTWEHNLLGHRTLITLKTRGVQGQKACLYFITSLQAIVSQVKLDCGSQKLTRQLKSTSIFGFFNPHIACSQASFGWLHCLSFDVDRLSKSVSLRGRTVWCINPLSELSIACSMSSGWWLQYLCTTVPGQPGTPPCSVETHEPLMIDCHQTRQTLLEGYIHTLYIYVCSRDREDLSSWKRAADPMFGQADPPWILYSSMRKASRHNHRTASPSSLQSRPSGNRLR